MLNKEKYTLDFIKKENLILFECISGSHAYGTNMDTSDLDKRGLFIMRQEDIYSFDYIEQINDEKNDITFYEIGRFLNLISVNNPNQLELLYSPEDCILYQHPVLDILFQNKEKFITKLCKDSFGNYASKQISKAKGMNKMMNWEEKKVSRKTILDFCYVIDGYNSYPLKEFLKKNKFEQKICGVAAIPHAKDMFALFYDITAHNCFSESIEQVDRERTKSALKALEKPFGLSYKGIVKEETESNELRLSSIPEGEKSVAIFSYNKDGYVQHCRDFLNYQTWIKNRNVQRWVDVKNHNQKIDGKNLLHCTRLISMCLEIAQGKGLIVRRPDAKELIDIRKGKVDLETIISNAEEKINKMDELFEKSNLTEKIDKNFVNDMLIKIRKDFYSV